MKNCLCFVTNRIACCIFNATLLGQVTPVYLIAMATCEFMNFIALYLYKFNIILQNQT